MPDPVTRMAGVPEPWGTHVRRLLLAICIVLSAVSACGVLGPPGSIPPEPIPSKACGGFHVVIDNVGGSAVSVALNGTILAEVKPGDTLNLAQWGSSGVPLMPWQVQVTRVADATVLLAVRLIDDGTDGRRFKVGDAPSDVATAYVC